MYRKDIFQEVLDYMDDGPCKISILIAMVMVHKECENII